MSAGRAPSTDAWLSRSEVRDLRLGDLVGEGAFSQVFRSEWKGHPVALKVARPEGRACLEKEAELLAAIPAVGVPSLLGADLLAAQPRLVLEYVDGRPLREAWQGLGAQQAERLALRVLVQVGRSLRALHGLGIVHGDVKPDNLLIGDDGSCMLIDLGLATRLEEPLRGGTSRYLAAHLGASLSGAARDEVALALTLAELVSPALREAPLSQASADLLPQPFRSLIGPLLAGERAASGDLAWLIDEGLRLMEGGGTDRSGEVAPEQLVRGAYLATRFDEIRRAAARGCGPENLKLEGPTGVWLRPLIDVQAQLVHSGPPSASSARSAAPAGSAAPARSAAPAGSAAPARSGALPNDPVVVQASGVASIAELSIRDRRRFLTRLVGPVAADWPAIEGSERWLIDRLCEALRERSPRALALGQLLRHPEQPNEFDPERLSDAKVATLLARRPVDERILVFVERADRDPHLLLEAARVLRQRNQLARAYRLLLKVGQLPEARLELCVLGRRSGNERYAEQAKQLAQEKDIPHSVRSAALALYARHRLDVTGPEAALDELAERSDAPAICEVRGLALLARGQVSPARDAVESGLALASEDEQRARLLAVAGMIAHREDLQEQASHAFRAAVEASVRAGAVLEEATYLTGLAAAAASIDRWSEALDTAERAELLFEALERPEMAARAILARGTLLAVVGAGPELAALVARGLRWARQSGDEACEAHLLMCLLDAGEADNPLTSARRVAELAANASEHLQARCRLLDAAAEEGLHTEWLEQGDEQARELPGSQASAEWWGARCRALVAGRGPNWEPDTALEEVERLAARPGVTTALGPALTAGARLAARLDRGASAKMLSSRAAQLAEATLSALPAWLAEHARAVPWIVESKSAAADRFEPAQLSDVEVLMRALGERHGLKDLLRKVLDLLLLWTGVQRGMILLKAPGDRLVVRAARNLARDDLTGEQLELSRSLAQRALAEGKEVVVVDAAGEASSSHRSVLALNLRSVLAAPLTARGQILGVVYLDDRLRRGAFGAKQRAWIRLISTLAALAIAEERDRLALRRAARRAKRAGERLSQELQSTEGQLERAERELSQAKSELRGDYPAIVARSSQMRRLLELADRVARSEVPLLITGESGTGKELIARAVARNGPRKDRPFVAENCSAVPEPLLESTLFGHVKGAFTGASKDRAGLFELADTGTLFLDEIGEMSLPMQAKLLRVLQDGQVRKVGAEKVRAVSVRIIAATHRDLRQLVAAGKFREDLLYRLDVVQLALPPLRERKDDILPLAEHFLSKYAPGQHRTLSRSVVARLEEYPWPGNVRQLENEVRRLLVLGGQPIAASDLSDELRRGPEPQQALTLKEKVDQLERSLVLEALEEAEGNRSQAARSLGLSRFGLQKKMQRLGLDDLELASPAR